MDRLAFRYVKMDSNEGLGVACVCYTFQRLEVDGKHQISYTAGIAFCSPKDKFSKQIARLKAQARFDGSTRLHAIGKRVEGIVTVPEPVTRFVSNAEFDIIFADMFAALDDNHVVPRWAAASVAENTFSFGLTETA